MQGGGDARGQGGSGPGCGGAHSASKGVVPHLDRKGTTVEALMGGTFPGG
jgi:hypothetical protein